MSKRKFEAEEYYHIGDREDLDKRYALAAGFKFLWPDEAAEQLPFLHQRQRGRRGFGLIA